MMVATLHPKALLTPKELAEAIGASESSMRRWVDSGDIRISRTAGGHRRIPLPEAIRFIRQLGAPVVRPDLLGLGEIGGVSTTPAGTNDEELLFEQLRNGDERAAKGLLISRYLEGLSLPALFDGAISSALRRLGDLWHHDPRTILLEHRATAICIEAVAMLRGLLPSPADDAPLALGGAPQGDPYLIPSMMVGAVLSSVGFRDVNFGGNTPIDLLAKEAVERKAKLVWLSVSTEQAEATLRDPLAQAARLLDHHEIRLVLGGRHHAGLVPEELRNVRSVASMAELDSLARDFVAGKG